MTYCQRKNKHYRHPKPNTIQTPFARRIKYHIALALTHNTTIARRARDYHTKIFYKAIADYLNHYGANKK